MLRARFHGQSSPSLLSSTIRGARAGDGEEIRSTLFRIRFDRVRISQVSRPSLIAVGTAGQVSGTVAKAGHATFRGDAARLPERRSPSRENRAHDSGQRGEPVEHGHEKQRQGDVYLARCHPRAARCQCGKTHRSRFKKNRIRSELRIANFISSHFKCLPLNLTHIARVRARRICRRRERRQGGADQRIAVRDRGRAGEPRPVKTSTADSGEVPAPAVAPERNGLLPIT